MRLPPFKVKRYANGRRFKYERGRYGGRGFVFAMQFGPGPGYCVWNDDRTKMLSVGWGLFAAYRSGSWQWDRRFRSREQTHLGRFAWHTGIEIGVTKRGNRIPWIAH